MAHFEVNIRKPWFDAGRFADDILFVDGIFMGLSYMVSRSKQ